MNVETLHLWLKPDTFRPCRIVLNNGTNYDIRHPEFAMLTAQGDLFVFRPSKSLDIADSLEAIIAVKNICNVEPLQQAA